MEPHPLQICNMHRSENCLLMRLGLCWVLQCVFFLFPPDNQVSLAQQIEEVFLHAHQVTSTMLGARKSKMNYIQSEFSRIFGLHALLFMATNALIKGCSQSAGWGERQIIKGCPEEVWAELSDERKLENIPFYLHSFCYVECFVAFLKLSHFKHVAETSEVSPQQQMGLSASKWIHKESLGLPPFMFQKLACIVFWTLG